jgi:hypothetical protein
MDKNDCLSFWRDYNKYDEPTPELKKEFQEIFDSIGDLNKLIETAVEIIDNNFTHGTADKNISKTYGSALGSNKIPVSVKEFCQGIYENKLPPQKIFHGKFHRTRTERTIKSKNLETKAKVVTNCRGKSLFFQSLVKYNDLYSRIRDGFTWSEKQEKYFCHAVVEISKNNSEWILVDPERHGKEDKFLFSYQAYDLVKNSEINPNKFVIYDRRGKDLVLESLCRDLLFVSNQVIPYKSSVSLKKTSQPEIYKDLAKILKKPDFNEILKYQDIIKVNYISQKQNSLGNIY